MQEQNKDYIESINRLKETRDHLQSIIDNTADAIVTSDLNGIITSWNKGAEKMYGFTAEEAVGKFLPMVPEWLMGEEREFLERIKRGETIRDIETVRRRKDRTIIDIVLTLSPIINSERKVIGISGIAKDITEKKRVEKELIKRMHELSRLYLISKAMRGTLNLDRLLRIILTAVTMGDGLGFNRAMLFLLDEDGTTLKGMMGVGPSSPEEAGRIWSELSENKITLESMIATIGEISESYLDRLMKDIEIDISGERTVMSLTVFEKKPFNIPDAKSDHRVNAFFIERFGTNSFATVPLVAKDKVIGVIVVDNLYSGRPITDDDINTLMMFANHAASSIENAQLFEKIVNAEIEMENIFNTIDDMIFFSDNNYRIKRVNRAMSKRLGFSEDEIIGRKCGELLPFFHRFHERAIKTRERIVEEVEDSRMNGVFLSSITPMFNTEGELIGALHVLRDVTEDRRLRRELANSEKMAVLGEMAMKISHEIRNPLVSIGGFARRMVREFDKEKDIEKQKATDIIIKEVNRLEGILHDLMSFVKEAPLHLQECNLNSLLSDIVSIFTAESEEKGIRIFKDIPKKEISISVDQEQLKQAIINILKNALQAVGRDGEVFIKAVLQPSPDGKIVLIEISDTGRGIEKGAIEHIFDPFFTTKSSGTGLGLAIAHRIIERHGGDIEVINRKGIGATFIIKLPQGR
ncbi:MAG: PAS domain S-box protein [Nitrospirota bacterium]